MNNNQLLNEIYQMYRNVEFGFNSLCMDCKNEAKSKGIELVNGPVPLYHIGKDYLDANKKVLIIGKVAYGWNDICEDQRSFWNNLFETWKKILNSKSWAVLGKYLGSQNLANSKNPFFLK